eukprot:CAMPEP_0172723098 /NCGR_PEP_ID=MMETSP1074-20121228/82991_1 /TAXON_ID=2916 /ORGANISM="Ceratium fusus, Strain PA161109" /LENGTH=44 /DNA_ID= /DNA_START= /DNA_END= /DNA_ORIENTATION=
MPNQIQKLDRGGSIQISGGRFLAKGYFGVADNAGNIFKRRSSLI